MQNLEELKDPAEPVLAFCRPSVPSGDEASRFRPPRVRRRDDRPGRRRGAGEVQDLDHVVGQLLGIKALADQPDWCRSSC